MSCGNLDYFDTCRQVNKKNRVGSFALGECDSKTHHPGTEKIKRHLVVGGQNCSFQSCPGIYEPWGEEEAKSVKPKSWVGENRIK